MEEVAGGAAVLVDPLEVGSIARRHREADAGATSSCRAASLAPASSRGRGPRTPSCDCGGSWREARRFDADVLGRQRTGDETYILNLLRELSVLAPAAGIRLAAVTRRPDLVREGIEPVELTRARRSCAWPCRCRVRSAASGPTSSTRSTPFRSAPRAPRWSRCTTSLSRATRAHGPEGSHGVPPGCPARGAAPRGC